MGQTELEAYDDALARFLALGGDDHDARAPGCWPRSASTRPRSRSPWSAVGRPAVKAGLAAVLLARFDVLLLDEPTNARLRRPGPPERFLAGEDRPVVLVSHDRAFLSAATTRIAELDLHSRRLATYGGGFDAYVEERRRRASRPTPTTTRPGPSGPGWRRRPARSGSGRSAAAASGAPTTTRPWPAGARSGPPPGRPRPRRSSAAWSALATPRNPGRAGTRACRCRPAGAAARSWPAWPVTAAASGWARSTWSLRWRDHLALTGSNGAGKSTLLGLLTGELRLTAGAVRLGSGGRRPPRPGPRPGTLLDAARFGTDLSVEQARLLLACSTSGPST